MRYKKINTEDLDMYYIECPVCEGTEMEEIGCSCNGSGEGMYDGSTCRYCNGAGTRSMECSNCGGEGEISIEDYISNLEETIRKLDRKYYTTTIKQI